MNETTNGAYGPNGQPSCPPNFQGQPNCPPPYPPYPPGKPRAVLPGRGGERALAAALLLLSVWTVNALLFGQARLGFALGGLGIEILSLCYLARRGLRPGLYGGVLQAGSAALLGSFAWADHSRGSALILLAVLGCWFLGLAQAMGCNRYAPGRFTGILDGFRVGFGETYGKIGAALRGLFHRKGEGPSRVAGPLVGLLLAIPILFFLVPLLISSDAAFAGLMENLFWNLLDLDEIVPSIAVGLLLFLPVYTRPVALGARGEREMPRPEQPGSFPPSALAGFLGAIAFFYVLYLISQFAYFFSAFSWLLPRDFTPAEYARRGFFEMAALCAADLILVGTALGGVRKKDGIPGYIRGLCAFFCLFSLVLIASAFSKMAYYMGAFGLTRLRVLTSAFMLCLAICFLGLLVRLFVPRFPYMKLAAGAAVVVVCALAWADVDAQVARYNVTAYETGRLESVDVDLLSTLKPSAAPYVARLTRDPDPEVCQAAADAMAAWQAELFTRGLTESEDAPAEVGWVPNGVFFRDWNWHQSQARAAIAAWAAEEGRVG